ncbi:MAG: PIN domain-containing protein [Actinomycetota bacterium]|nr:PIN domain-containing protein [Actinomycetota bacterium]
MILVDTGPIVAAASKRDEHHASCLAALSTLLEPPLITPLVVMEVCYFLSTRASPRRRGRVLALGRHRLLRTGHADQRGPPPLRRAGPTLRKPALGAADASVIAVSERLNVRQILTLDRAHFSIVRPRHVDVFELLP